MVIASRLRTIRSSSSCLFSRIFLNLFISVFVITFSFVTNYHARQYCSKLSPSLTFRRRHYPKRFNNGITVYLQQSARCTYQLCRKVGLQRTQLSNSFGCYRRELLPGCPAPLLRQGGAFRISESYHSL